MPVSCEEVARLGKGISNPNRYRIVQELMRGSRTVNQIADAVGLSQPHVSQSLRVLKEAGLVKDRRQGQEVRYALDVPYMALILREITNVTRKGIATKHT